MKKLVLSLIVMAAASTAAFAQSADVNIAAVILDQLTITQAADIDFGNVSAGTTATIAASSASAGKVEISGQNGSTVVVTAPTSINLTGPGADITTAISYLGSDADVQAGALVGNLGGGGGNVTLSAAGFFIWVGAEFTTLNTQVSGSYTADLTIEVQYL
jgi:hypothetical protein